MSRKILVAYDGSDLSKLAIDEAKVQAKFGEDPEIHVVTVVTPGISSNNTAVSGNLSMSDAEKLYPELEKIKDELKGFSLQVKTQIITDFSQKNPGIAISDYAEENDIDLIIVGHRGLSNLKKLLMGSVSSTIVQRATCHVLIVK